MGTNGGHHMYNSLGGLNKQYHIWEEFNDMQCQRKKDGGNYEQRQTATILAVHD